MLTQTEPFAIERQRHRAGEALRSRDFADAADAWAHLRWWHNRALHATWGIATGFAVRLESAHGDTHVVVEPGIAYDCFGRELIESTTRTMTAPDAEHPLTLLARVPAHRDTCCESPQGCSPACGPRPHVDLMWKPSRGLRPVDGVRVAEILTVPGAPLHALPEGFTFEESLAAKVRFDADRRLLLAIQPLSDDERVRLRRSASTESLRLAVDTLLSGTHKARVDRPAARKILRSLARPRIATGTTFPGQGWEPWTVSLYSGRRVIEVGIQTRVDTAAAGFTATPCYFPWLQGELWSARSGRWLWLFEHMDELSSGGFLFRVSSGASLRRESELLDLARERKFFVCWLGIQQVAGAGRTGVAHGHP